MTSTQQQSNQFFGANTMNLSTQKQQTMLSTEIVKIINDMRDEGAAELRHDNFMAKVIIVLGEKDALKFKGIYRDTYGREKPCYHLPKREAELMVMSESYKVQAAVYDRMTELEQQASKPKLLSPAEMLLAQAQLSVELEKRIGANETKVEQVEAKVEQISIDLRNGVPRGFISRANALKMYSQGLSKDVFEKALTAYEVPTKPYVHYSDGHSTSTFAYQEDRIVTVINHFIRELVQETKCQCYSKLLNKRVNYKKPVPYGSKEGGAIGDTK